MEVLVAVALLVVALIAGLFLLKLTFQLAFFVIGGLVIGFVARAVLPGRQDIGWLKTIGAGVAGSMAGGVLAALLNLGWLLKMGAAVAVAALAVHWLAGKDRPRLP